MLSCCAFTVQLPCSYRAVIMQLPCSNRAVTVQLPCNYRAVTMQLPCSYRAVTVQLLCSYCAVQEHRGSGNATCGGTSICNSHRRTPVTRQTSSWHAESPARLAAGPCDLRGRRCIGACPGGAARHRRQPCRPQCGRKSGQRRKMLAFGYRSCCCCCCSML